MIVWLASYPRSGNTFFRVILNSIFDIKTHSIYDDKGDIGADEKTSDVVGHKFLPKNFNIEKARESAKIFYIKTHELLDNRVDDKDKVIYLIRDGRESTLSFTKHQNTYSNQNKSLTDTIYGNTFIGGWGEHVSSWNPKKRNNTLLIKFEELINEPISFIKTLATFLDIKPIGDTIPSFEELKKINPKFFRSGKVSSWKNIYTNKEHFSFWLKNYEVMDEYQYKSDRPKQLDILIDESSIELELARQNNYLIKLSLLSKDSFDKLIRSKEQQYLQKTEELKNKNKELAQKEIVIQNKTNEYKTIEQQLYKRTQEVTNLLASLDSLCKASTYRSPVKKMILYKQMLKTYHKMKDA